VVDVVLVEPCVVEPEVWESRDTCISRVRLAVCVKKSYRVPEFVAHDGFAAVRVEARSRPGVYLQPLAKATLIRVRAAANPIRWAIHPTKRTRPVIANVHAHVNVVRSICILGKNKVRRLVAPENGII